MLELLIVWDVFLKAVERWWRQVRHTPQHRRSAEHCITVALLLDAEKLFAARVEPVAYPPFGRPPAPSVDVRRVLRDARILAAAA